jgi:hypothetical protein
MNIFEKFGIKRTAISVSRGAIFLKGAVIATAGLIAITGITYAISIFFEQTGSFTVKLSKYDMMQAGISLSPTRKFEKPTSRLSAKPLQNVDNISVNDLPKNLYDIDGEHSTKNYIAYTFYLKNAGKSTCTYSMSFDISGVTQGVDEAVRIRVIYNDKQTDYAKIKRDRLAPEKGTVPFLSQTVATKNQVEKFGVGEIDKYCVVIWLEGDDPDCVDEIIGGTIKMEMNFKIVESS